MGDKHREPDGQAADRAWVRRWRRVGPQLRRIAWEELAAMSPEQQALAIDALFEVGYRLPAPRTSSGLVEQQRLFKKARR